MTGELNVEGMSLAGGVVETIVSIAANDVEGVASVGSFTTSGFRSIFTKPSTSGIAVSTDENDRLTITLHIEVYYGYVLPDLAAQLRRAVADALQMQIGVDVDAIDIYVDGIQFAA